MSTLETNLIQPSSGTTLTVGASGDTITVPSGATITNSGTATGFPGMWEFISQSTASSSSEIDFTSFSTDFKDFCVEIQSCRHGTDNVYPEFRIFDSGGSLVSSSSPGYQWVYHGRSTSVYSTAQNSSQGEIRYAPQIGNAGSEGLNGFIYLYNVHDTGDQYKQFMFMNSSQNTSGNIQITHGCAGYKASAAPISGIRLFPSSGNIAVGNFALYGRKRA